MFSEKKLQHFLLLCNKPLYQGNLFDLFLVQGSEEEFCPLKSNNISDRYIS